MSPNLKPYSLRHHSLTAYSIDDCWFSFLNLLFIYLPLKPMIRYFPGVFNLSELLILLSYNSFCLNYAIDALTYGAGNLHVAGDRIFNYVVFSPVSPKAL